MEYRLEGETPSRRAYQASFIHQDFLYIHGGHDIREGAQDTLWRVDISHKNKEPQWEKVNFKKSKSPGAIAYHTMTFVDGKVYLIGGSTLGEDSTKDYMLSLESLEWSIIDRKGSDAPASIDEHTANLYGSKIIIFGGNISGTKSNTIFLFHLKTKTWEKLQPSDGPCARSCHSAVIYSNCLYVFGGKDQDRNKLDDFWKFDITAQTWTEIPKTRETPMKRSGHSAIIYKNLMVIFGGIHELTQELNDMHTFDFNNSQWTALATEIENQSPKLTDSIDRKSFVKSNTVVSIPKTHESKYGSPLKLDTDSKEFGISMKMTEKRHTRHSNIVNISGRLTLSKLERIVNKKRTAQEQFNEESLLTSPTSLLMKNSFLIKTIGKTFENYYNQNKKKKTGILKGDDEIKHYEKKKKGKIEGRIPKPRDGHSCLVYDERFLIIFGGDRHHVPFNDLFTLDLAKEI